MKPLFFFLILAAGAALVNERAYASSYAIDSVIDTDTGDDWLDSTPTLNANQTYNISLEASVIELLTVPDSDVRLGLFIDFGGVRSELDWASFPESALISEASAISHPIPIPVSFYSATGSFTTPSVFTASQGSAFTYLNLDETSNPNASAALLSQQTRFFDVNLGPQTTTVPEPSSVALCVLGLAGAAFLRSRTRRFQTA